MEFKQAIKMYLDVQSMSDAEFAAKYANENKSIDECVLYIQSVMCQKALDAHKQASEGKDKENKPSSACVVPTDEEVFTLAVRYYMDDDLKVDGTEFDNIKVLSMSATTFTQEEKDKMRQDAIRQYQDEVIAEQKRKAKEAAEKKNKKNTNAAKKTSTQSAPVIVPDAPATSDTPAKQDDKEEKPARVVQLSLF